MTKFEISLLLFLMKFVDARKEPILAKLIGENIDEKTAKIGDEARLDISAVGF